MSSYQLMARHDDPQPDSPATRRSARASHQGLWTTLESVMTTIATTTAPLGFACGKPQNYGPITPDQLKFANKAVADRYDYCRNKWFGSRGALGSRLGLLRATNLVITDLSETDCIKRKALMILI